MTPHLPADQADDIYTERALSAAASIERIADGTDPNAIRFSVVVPTFNEKESIEQTLASLYQTIQLDPSLFEVIVVDESTDQTPAVIRSLDWPNLYLVRFEQTMGLAHSVIEGFNAACGTYVGVIDADGQHPPAKLYELFETAIDSDHDVVVASRYVDGGGIENWSLFRKLVSGGATLIARGLLLHDISISDPMSGFFVVRRSLLEDISLNPVGYKILLDILVRTSDISLQEVGYVFADREQGESNLDYTEYINYLHHVGRLIWFRLTS